MNTPFETLLYPSPLEIFEYWEQHWRSYLQRWQELEKFFGPLWSPKPKHRSTVRLHKGRLSKFESLMHSVRKGKNPGEYIGAAMTKKRTRKAAAASGDKNPVHLSKPHPRFGKLIAHGMDGVTQALAALKLELKGTKLVPIKVEIGFKSPVFLEEDSLHRITVECPADQSPLVRFVEVWACNKHTKEERLVINLTAHLQENPDFKDSDWLYVLVAAWRISALLAKTWKECLYVKQVLHIDHPGQKPLHLEVAVEAREMTERGHLRVHTHSHGGMRHRPVAHGEAVIIPQKKV